jgi:hypothetical protein
MPVLESNFKEVSRGWRRAQKEVRLERATETNVVNYAKVRGVESVKLNLQGHCGMPDRMFFIRGGKPLLAEFKKQGKKPTKLQAHTIKKLRELGYNVEVIDNTVAGHAVITAYIQMAAEEAANAPFVGPMPRYRGPRSTPAVGAARVHENVREVSTATQRRGVVPRSGSRENVSNAKSNPSVKRKRNAEARAGNSPTAPVLPSMARRNTKVDRFQRAALQYFTRSKERKSTGR